MNKFWILSIAVIILIGIVAFGFLFIGSGNKPLVTGSPTGQYPGLPMASPVEQTGTVGTSQETTISLTTSSGESIVVKDFLKDPTTVKDPFIPNYYYLGYHTNVGVSDPTATDNPPYIIGYIADTQYFNIALLQEPVGLVREEAQRYLMDRLGIEEDQMCKIDYTVSVPVSVNAVYSGRSLGFSFCPGAVVMPK